MCFDEPGRIAIIFIGCSSSLIGEKGIPMKISRMHKSVGCIASIWHDIEINQVFYGE